MDEEDAAAVDARSIYIGNVSYRLPSLSSPVLGIQTDLDWSLMYRWTTARRQRRSRRTSRLVAR